MPQFILISFKSDLPDEATCEDDVVNDPAGREHAKLLQTHLAGSFRLVREPWNEEDYAWESQVQAEGVTVSIQVGKVEDDWQIQIFPVALFGFLRRKRLLAAMEAVATAVEKFLREEGRFSEIGREVEE